MDSVRPLAAIFRISFAAALALILVLGLAELRLQTTGSEPGQVGDPSVAGKAIRSAAAEPDDPLFGRQWHHGMIQSRDAWPFADGAGSLVAIVGGQLDCGHPELARRCLPAIDLLGDRSRGAIAQFTAAAMLLAAERNNGRGGVGLAPEAQLLPVRVLADDGSAVMSELALGIDRASEAGADIILVGFGSLFDSRVLQESVLRARAAGSLIIAPAGLAGAPSSKVYPAAYAEVLAVSATGASDGPARHVLPGARVDLCAPGEDLVAGFGTEGAGTWSGQILAAALVTGLAALLHDQDPGRDPDALTRLLVEHAVDLGPPGLDPFFGAGRIDALASLTAGATGPGARPPKSGEPPSPPIDCDRAWRIGLAAFPDTVGVGGYRCPGCDGVYGAADRAASSNCPLSRLRVRISDAAEPARVLWQGELQALSAGGAELRSGLRLCQPPPYLVTLLDTETACHRLCPNAPVAYRLEQADFDATRAAAPGRGRHIDLAWRFWQCTP